jgi:hypothetical protein
MKRILLALITVISAQAQQPAPPPAAATPPEAPSPGYVFPRFHVQDNLRGSGELPDFPVDQPDGQLSDFPYKPGTSSAQLGARPSRHSIDDFRPEPRDVFHLMDQVMTSVPDSPDRRLMPLDFGVKPGVYDQHAPGQRAIFGRNTWLLWCGGNEDFWGEFLAQKSYAILDFLKAIDSRKRSTRFKDLGLINQPGLKSSDEPGPFGLYLDSVDKLIGEEGNFTPFPGKKVTSAGQQAMTSDGVDPSVYGYPSGVIGLRLFPNPKFDEKAKAHWNAKAFYDDPTYAADPRTVRPLLVGMSCAICHVAMHPLNLPDNPEEPKWENLSSLIGNQYFRTSSSFASRVTQGNFLWHYVASQQPGTIDTSMVSTDNINNANSMNGVFELPSRLQRAKLNPGETMSPIAQSLEGIGKENRQIPRILMSGEDSIGVIAALARVYINIGLYHEEWARCSNTLIGMGPTRPISIDACRRNSVYWRVNENFRMGYLQDFFTWETRDAATNQRIQCSTQAMRLPDAVVTDPDGTRVSFLKSTSPVIKPHQWEEKTAHQGAKVFTEHCMICHSSKQPDGFKVDFAHQPPAGATKWSDAPEQADAITLPFSFDDWEDFKTSASYTRYVAKASKISGNGDPERTKAFVQDNFLSTDLRIPVSLTETNAGRAVATNAIAGQVWSEFSSETYKQLPPSGPVKYWDAFAKEEKTWQPPAGGRGYYRVPSLVSVWATAPLLHNNALGHYIPDEDAALRVSVEGRLQMFDDAVRKLLWKSKRPQSPSGEEGRRDPAPSIWHGADPGWIFRTSIDSQVAFPRGHIRKLIGGVLPGFVPAPLLPMVNYLLANPWIAPLILSLLSALIFLLWKRTFCILMVITGLLLILLLAISGVHYLLPGAIWLLPLLLLIGGIVRLAGPQGQAVGTERLTLNSSFWAIVHRAVYRGGLAAFFLLFVGLYGGLWAGQEFVNGKLGDLEFGPLPKGTPVNSLMNMDPAAPITDQLAAVRGLLSTVAKLRADNARPIDEQLSEQERLEIFNREAGPALLRASKCPDWELDRGHYFGEALSDAEKEALIAFLKTL